MNPIFIEKFSSSLNKIKYKKRRKRAKKIL